MPQIAEPKGTFVPGFSTAPDGAFVDITWKVVSVADGTVFVMTDETGHGFIQINGASMVVAPATGGGLALNDGANTRQIAVQTGKVLMENLPAADPHLAGQLYTSAGTVKVSAG